MQLRFKTIRWKNFISYGNTWTEVDLSGHDSTLIIGKNGEGKSTLLDVLTYGLYNKPFRKIKKDQLVNSINEKDCLVEVTFEVNNGEYLVRRGIKPAIFEVYFNGQLINQDNKSRDYQKVLEKQILKQSYRSFTQMEVLGSAKYQPFMELPTFARREITEELLDLSLFSVMAEGIKQTIAQHKASLTDLNSEVTGIKRSINDNREFLSHIETNKGKQIDEFKAELEELDLKLRDASGDLEEISATFEEKVVGDSELATRKANIDKLASEIRELDTAIAKAAKDARFFELNSTCPTCAQEISKDFKMHTCATIDQESHLMKEDRVNKKTFYDEALAKYNDDLTYSIEMKEKRMKAMNRLQATNSEMMKIRDRIKKLEETEDVSYLEYQQKLDNLVASLNEYEIKYKKGIAKLKYFDLCLKLSSDSGIKSKIVSTYLPLINSLINKYLSMMDFYISFYLDENFDETIKSRHRDKFSYSSFSEGEKARINTAILFTMIEIAKVKNSISTNLLCMDEIFDSSLDAEGIDFISKLLKESDMNIFIISHNDKMRDKFNRVLLAEKVGNFSTIREL